MMYEGGVPDSFSTKAPASTEFSDQKQQTFSPELLCPRVSMPKKQAGENSKKAAGNAKV